MGLVIDPANVARAIRDEIRDEVQTLDRSLRLVGFLATSLGPSQTYANYTRIGCESVGIKFELRRVRRFELEDAIESANRDPEIHGIIVYYPVFGPEQDNYIKDQVDPRKDVEGLNTTWLRKLYRNERTDVYGNKAILPCTPLAIIKLLDAAGDSEAGVAPLSGRTVAIFNRSEVVGRPLAYMMAHDGADVFSFDVYGLIKLNAEGIRESTASRSYALRAADIVITGVPDKSFPLIEADEIRSSAVCINFSTIKNFTDEAAEKARVFIPRVGPMTVTMALRNTLRLFNSYHKDDADTPCRPL